MRSAALVAIFALAPLVDAATQQRLPRIAPGQRVQVTCPAAGLRKTTADFQGLEGDSLVLLVHPQRANWTAPAAAGDSNRIVRLPVSSVTSLKTYRGRGSSPARIVAMGLGGAALGAGIGWGVGRHIDESRPEGGFNLDFGQAFGPPVGAAIGLVAGVVIGSLIKSDRWQEVRLDRVRVTMASCRNRVALAAAVSF